MKILRKLISPTLSAFAVILITVSCSKTKEPTATINVSSATTNKSGDLSGNGGTASKTFTFNNSSTTAGWDMSINASNGSFQLILKDANGTIKLDKTITAGVGAQSADGTTPEGTAGVWTATIQLTHFKGSGDYSFR